MLIWIEKEDRIVLEFSESIHVLYEHHPFDDNDDTGENDNTVTRMSNQEDDDDDDDDDDDG